MMIPNKSLVSIHQPIIDFPGPNLSPSLPPKTFKFMIQLVENIAALAFPLAAVPNPGTTYPTP